MSRSRFTKTKKRLDGVQQYTSLNLPSFSETSDDIVINVSRGTRLDMLAQQFFGDATLWWVIAMYNNIGDASLYLRDDISYLRIPNDIQQVFNEIKSLN